jgi:hypothetical protein
MASRLQRGCATRRMPGRLRPQAIRFLRAFNEVSRSLAAHERPATPTCVQTASRSIEEQGPQPWTSTTG